MNRVFASSLKSKVKIIEIHTVTIVEKTPDTAEQTWLTVTHALPENVKAPTLKKKHVDSVVAPRQLKKDCYGKIDQLGGSAIDKNTPCTCMVNAEENNGRVVEARPCLSELRPLNCGSLPHPNPR